MGPSVIGFVSRWQARGGPMSAPLWNPPVETSKREKLVLRRLTRTGKLFAFLRNQRNAIFDEAFQHELGSMYRDTDEGRTPVPPALLAMATVLQAYSHVSDAEAVDRATFDARWQMVLGVLGVSEPPFSQGALSAFRQRLIEHDMDRRLLERTVEFARASKGFDAKKLPRSLRIAVDSRPLAGAGRVEDTVNLLGRAGRQLLLCAATIARVDPDELAEEIGAAELLESSIKAALDVDWTDLNQKSEAMQRLLTAIGAIEKYVADELSAQSSGPPLADHLAMIARLREQNLDPEPDGGGPKVRDGVAADRTISLSDPEMRHGRKSKSKTINGYKAHVATDLDDDVVIGCAVLPANRPEREGLDAMREDLDRIVGEDSITELHADRGYTNARLTYELARMGTEILSKPRPVRGKPFLFDKNDFKIDLRKKTATCPQGETVPIVLGEVAHFDANACGRCPCRGDCTTAADGKGRSLSIAADEHQQKKFAKLVRSSRGRARLRERVAIEHTLAHHARVQGTKARFRGTRKNLYDARRAGAVLNLESARRHLAHAA
jgi:hypothetical protein